jgi:hypothetical protein
VTDGEWRPDRPLDVRTLLSAHWIPAKRLEECRESTVARYESVARDLIFPYLGAERVASLTSQTIQHWQTKLADKGSPPGPGKWPSPS